MVSLIGSKEGIAHFPLAYVNPGDLVLVATPNYPVYGVATEFAGGVVEYLPLLEENDFLVDLDAVSNDDLGQGQDDLRLLPEQPDRGHGHQGILRPADREGQGIRRHRPFHDAAYTEIYYDPANKPLSIMECEGAKDVAIEFHSLSKTYNMTGWRVGMAVGNASLIAGLGKIKENVDSGIFQAVQEAGIAALQRRASPLPRSFRAIYKERRDVV